MNLFSVILLVLIGIWFVVSIWYLMKHRGQGCGGCSGDCQHCRNHCKRK